MTSSFNQTYLSADDDDKMELLANITQPLTPEAFKFLFTQLGEYEDEDEFVMIEIIKVLALYSPNEKHKDVIKLLFQIIKNSDDELLQSHAMHGLEHLNLSQKDYENITKIKNSTDNENLQAIADMIFLRKNNAL